MSVPATDDAATHAEKLVTVLRVRAESDDQFYMAVICASLQASGYASDDLVKLSPLWLCILLLSDCQLSLEQIGALREENDALRSMVEASDAIVPGGVS